MANTPVVYSENDRHALLKSIAEQVTKQVHENPHPDHLMDEHNAPTVHVLTSGSGK